MLANHPNIQTQDVAATLAIHPFMLSRWKKEMRESKVKAGKSSTSPPATDLTDAGRRIRELERESARAQANHALVSVMRGVHRETDRADGSPRIHRELVARRYERGRHRVARLMRIHGLVAQRRQRYRASAAMWQAFMPGSITVCSSTTRPGEPMNCGQAITPICAHPKVGFISRWSWTRTLAV